MKSVTFYIDPKTKISLMRVFSATSDVNVKLDIDLKNNAIVVQDLDEDQFELAQTFIQQFGKIKSITMDNGAEFSDVAGIERSVYSGKRTSTYYCHPYCSSERGSNERLNREIRRLVPKGTDLSKYTVADVKKIERWVNTYPRMILGFATSEELFTQHLSCIA